MSACSKRFCNHSYEWVTATIGGYGLFAVFVLMLLESLGFLIPSEPISPFAGYLVSEGRTTLFGAVTARVLDPVWLLNRLLHWLVGRVGAAVPLRALPRGAQAPPDHRREAVLLACVATGCEPLDDRLHQTFDDPPRCGKGGLERPAR